MENNKKLNQGGNLKREKIEYLRKVYFMHFSADSVTQDILESLSFVCCRVWNLAIEKCQGLLESKEAISHFTLNKWLTGIRNDHEPVGFCKTSIYFSDISCNLMQEMMRKIAGSFSSYFQLRKKGDTEARKPAFKKDGDWVTLSWSLPKIRVVGNDLFLEVPAFTASGQKRPLVIKLNDFLKGKVVDRDVKHCTINRMRDGRYKLNLVVAIPKPSVCEPESVKSVMAIDLGAGYTAVSEARSDGTGVEYLIQNRRPDKHWKEATQSVESRISLCKKGSRTYKRRMKARRRMFGKMDRQQPDFQRKLAHALLCVDGRPDVVCVGKMNVRLGLAQSENGSSKQHFGSQNTGMLHRTKTFLKEKAEEEGIIFIEKPDPPRSGELSEPESKFVASRQLLEAACSEYGLDVPSSFTRIKKRIRERK